jgi:hypothetical protein
MRSDGRSAASEMTAKSDDNFEMSNGTAQPPGHKFGTSGPSSFRDDRSPAGLLSAVSGEGTTGDTGSTRGSLSTRTMDDRRSIGRTKISKDAFLFFGEQTGVRPCAVTDSQTPAPAFAPTICRPYR